MITDPDEAVERVVGMIKDKRVKTISGNYIDICPDSVCVHGDSEKALLFVKKIRDTLISEGIEIKPIDEIISGR